MGRKQPFLTGYGLYNKVAYGRQKKGGRRFRRPKSGVLAHNSMELQTIMKEVYVRPKDILKTFIKKQGEKKLRKYLYWGYILTKDIKESLKNTLNEDFYDSGIPYKEVIQSYYKYVKLEISNKRNKIEAPAVVYYRVFYPSTIEQGKVDISINSPYVDIPCGMNLVNSDSHFAGPCIITCIEKENIAPRCATFNPGTVLPANLQGIVYMKEHYDNIYIYTKHKKASLKPDKKTIDVVKEAWE